MKIDCFCVTIPIDMSKFFVSFIFFINPSRPHVSILGFIVCNSIKEDVMDNEEH